MPSIAYSGTRRVIDEPLAEIVVQAEGGERMSFFVQWADLEKAWALVDFCVDESHRDIQTIHSSEGA